LANPGPKSYVRFSRYSVQK
jgi:hypothetical protein